MKYIPGDIVLLPDRWGSGERRPHLVIRIDRCGLCICPLSSCATGRIRSDRLPARPGGLNRPSYVAAVDGIHQGRKHLFWAEPQTDWRHVGTLDQELMQVALLAVTRQLLLRKTAIQPIRR